MRLHLYCYTISHQVHAYVAKNNNYYDKHMELYWNFNMITKSYIQSLFWGQIESVCIISVCSIEVTVCSIRVVVYFG